MSDNSSNNKRIAKNTVFLYIRMLMIMAVTLYTSRIILSALGATDFGVYNVVGGIVALFSFLNATLATGTQRFITFALGKNDRKELQKTVSISIMFHFILAIFVVFLIESIGLWFLYNKMVIPDDRMNAAFWVLQFSTISCALSITQVPYNACIISHERMGAFAYISIIDVLFKLAIACAVLFFPKDRLILYGFLITCTSIITLLIYRFYCLRHFEESHFHYSRDKKLEKEILIFSSWNMAGTLPSTLSTQGFNLMINTFYGPIVNAAISITNQINGAILQFVTNFQTAANPQITKLYASDEKYEMYRLISNSSKFSCFISLFFIVPLFIEMDYVLHLWLGDNVPMYTTEFARIVLFQNLISAAVNPLITCSTSAGRLKVPAIAVGGVMLLSLPISYILLRLNISAPLVFLITTIPYIFRLCFYIYFDKQLIGYFGVQYIKDVLVKVTIILLGVYILSYMPAIFLSKSFIRLICVTVTSSISTILFVYYYGINKDLRKHIVQWVNIKLGKI